MRVWSVWFAIIANYSIVTIILFLSLSLSRRLLSEANERRFDSRQVIALPRKRMKKRTEKSHLYDFPKPIWAKKKKVLYTPGPEKNVKEEE